MKDSPQLWRSVSLAAETLGVRHPSQEVALSAGGSDGDAVLTADALAGAAQRLAWLAGVAPDELVRASVCIGSLM